MKYIDASIQTMSLLVAVGSLTASIWYRESMLFFLVNQFFMGVWQVLACVISLLVHRDRNDSRRLHITLSGIYLLSLFMLGGLHIDFPKWLVITYLTAPAWTLAIYYYAITLRGVFPRTKQSNFLPHLGF